MAHPDPDMVDVGLQGGNPVADHVIGTIASEMVHVHISETVLGHILEPGTEIVDPETPVDCSRLWALVTWNADNPGFDPGSSSWRLKAGPARWLKSLSLWLVSRSLIRLKTLTLRLEMWSRRLLARAR